MTKTQASILARCKADVTNALVAIDAAAANAVTAAVRMRAALDVVDDLPPNPAYAISLGHQAVANYLRITAAEHDSEA